LNKFNYLSLFSFPKIEGKNLLKNGKEKTLYLYELKQYSGIPMDKYGVLFRIFPIYDFCFLWI